MELPMLGRRIPTEDAEALRLRIYDELGMQASKAKDRFVGCHPVTLTLDNIDLLLTTDFLVCEKSDGVRALLLIVADTHGTRAYFYDRKNDFYELDTAFPFGSTVLLDGEVFLEDSTTPTYAIFDCLIYEGTPQTSRNLYKRLGYAQMFVDRMKRNSESIGPVRAENDDGPGKRRATAPVGLLKPHPLPIHFYVKEMLKSYGFWEIYKKIPQLRHGNDGLIFTPVNDPYCVGRRGVILKWKPASLNTIDFKIVKQGESSLVYGLVCSGKRGKDVVFDHFFYTQSDEIDGKIGEFLYDNQGYYWDLDGLVLVKGGWKLYKIRTDKDSPNNIRVVCNILESFKDDLSIEKLSKFYTTMRENSKSREKSGK